MSEALAELNLQCGRPVIVLVGGYIPGENAKVTQKAIESIAAYAEKNNLLIICGDSCWSHGIDRQHQAGARISISTAWDHS